nr:MAG TPA: hypothetical protein [Bacteriophage sp.]
MKKNRKVTTLTCLNMDFYQLGHLNRIQVGKILILLLI